MGSKMGIAAACLGASVIAVLYLGRLWEGATETTPPNSAAAALSTAQLFADWKEFVPQSRLFKVRLPTPPQYAKDTLAMPNSDQKRRFDMYASEKINGTLFLINVITYPESADTALDQEVLQETVAELVKNKPDNALKKHEHTFFQSYPALDFSIVNSEFFVEGKAFMVDRMIYILSYVTHTGEFDPSEYRYFIDSFQILPKPTG